MKSIFLSVVALFIISIVHAQTSFHAGLKLGTNVNKIDGVSFKDKFTYGYSAGAFAEIGLSKKWGLQPELVFNEVNSDTSDKFSQLYKINSATIKDISLKYLSIPLLVNYYPSKIIAFQLGPQYGILLSQTENLVEGVKTAFKNGDFSLLGGVQVRLGSLRLYGRYALGLNSINDIDNRDKWKNQSIQLGIGFTIL